MSGYLPQAVRPHAADSRLLSNLIRSEKDYASNLSSAVHSAFTASSALAAWGTSEVQDVGATSEELSRLLHDVAEAQRTHVQALEGYRAALKDILDRESSIRDIVRDRDILVNRLIKASKKKHKEGREEEREIKIQDAQRELQACEQILATEEAALIGVKRRTFKEALTMRMKTMGDVGNAMVEAAQEAILLLDDFDSNVVASAMMPTGGGEIAYDEAQYYDDGYGDEQQVADSHAYNQQGLPDGYHHPADTSGAFENASVTPSQSASQVAASGGGGVQQYQNFRSSRQDGLGATTNGGVPAPHQLGPDAGTGGEAFMPAERQAPASNLEPGMTLAPLPVPPPPSHPHASTQRERIERASQAPMPQIEMPPIPQAYRAGQQMQFGAPSPAAPTPPAKDQGAVSFPRYQQQQATGMGNGAAAQQEDSSSDEEDDRPTIAHAGGRAQSVPQPAARGGNHARNFSADMSSSATGGSGAFDRGQIASPDPSGMGKKKSSFLGRVGKLFKTDVAQPIGRQTPTPERRTEGWHTRTDSNARSASRNEIPASGLSRSASRRSTLLSGHAFQAPSQRQEADSSDEDEPQGVVRHTNPSRPLWQTSASDVGPSPLKRGLLKRNDSSASRFSITAGPQSWKQKQEEEEMMRRARLSVVGAGIGGGTGAAAASANDLAPSEKKKKKKRTPSVTGSEIGTSATRVAPAAPSAVANKRSSVIVPGDASMGIRRSDSLNTTGRGSVKGKSSKKRQSLSGVSMSDGKYATASWVTQPGGNAPGSEQPKTAADYVANAGVVPKGQGQSTREAVSGATQAVQENSYSSLSRANSSSLKPALKGSLRRNNSVKSNASTSRPPLPDLGPVMRAPPPATSLLKDDNIYKGPVAGQLPPVPQAPASVSSNVQQQAGGRQAQTHASPGKVRASEPPRLSDLSEGQARETDAESFSSALEDGEEAPKRAQSSVSANRPILASNQSFDGTGALDMSMNETPKSDSTAEAPTAQASQRVSALPKLEMPVHEPFSFSMDGRKGSNAGVSDPENSGLITPGEQSAIQKLLSAGDEKDKEIPKKGLDARTPDGVTRVTARSTKLAPSRVYGSGAPEVSSSSDDESLASERPRVPNFSVAPSSATHSSTPLASALRSPSPAPKGVLVNAPGSVAGSTAMSDASGSVIGRRKSVRLAPDTKLPPETPTSPAPPPLPAIPFHAHAPGSSVVGSESTPALSSRIAPPPAAPARVAKEEGPHTLANDSSSRPGWSTRIGALDDSSDEDIVGGGDDYSKARRAFSSASRHLGKATGTTKPKATDDGTSSIGKKKKRSSKANFGYNPEVPLPPTMQVVGRSNSTRK